MLTVHRCPAFSLPEISRCFYCRCLYQCSSATAAIAPMPTPLSLSSCASAPIYISVQLPPNPSLLYCSRHNICRAMQALPPPSLLCQATPLSPLLHTSGDAATSTPTPLLLYAPSLHRCHHHHFHVPVSIYHRRAIPLSPLTRTSTTFSKTPSPLLSQSLLRQYHHNRPHVTIFDAPYLYLHSTTLLRLSISSRYRC